MRKVVIAMLAAGALAAPGCEEKKPETKPATSAPSAAATAHATAAPAKTGAPGGGW